MRKFTLFSLLLCLSIGCYAQLEGAKISQEQVRLQSSSKNTLKESTDKNRVFQSALQGEPDFRLMSSYRQTGLNGKARVVLIADPVYGNKVGCQLLLDADCTASDQVETIDYGFMKESFYRGTDYSAFEYKIPANATTDPTDQTFVTDGKKDSVDIPAGSYDMCIIRDRRNSQLQLATDQNWKKVNFSGDFVYVFYFHYGFLDNATASTLKYDFGVSPAWDWGAGTLSNAEPVQFVLNNYGHVSHDKPVKCYYQIDNGTPVMHQLAKVPEPGMSETVTFSQPADLSALRSYDVKIWIDDELGWTTINDTAKFKVNHYEPLEIPYQESFNMADYDKFMNLWTIANLNNNENTWEVSEDNNEVGNGYMTYQCNEKANADELLISPRLKAVAGEYNLHFQFKTSGAQKMKVYIHTQPSIEGAELLDEFTTESTNGAWMDQYYNFARDKESSIYVIFHLISGTNTSTFFIDNIGVSEGKVELSSDVVIERITPPAPTCGMHQYQSLKIVLKNNGAVTAKKYILNAKLNEGEVFTEEFTQAIPSFGSIEVSFPLYDEGFTTTGQHHITVWGTCEQQTNPIVEQFSSTAHFTAGELPINTTFDNEDCYQNWAPADPSYWDLAESIGYWACTLSQSDGATIQPDLISRCMSLKAGKTYRIEICYSGGSGRADMFEVLMGETYNPSKYWTTQIGVVSKILNAVEKWAVFTFTAKNDGDYGVAIRSWQDSRNLAFHEININEVFENDITVTKVRSNLYAQTPVHMTKGVINVAASVKNHGSADITNAKIQVKVAEQGLITSSEIKNLSSDSVTVIASTANFDNLFQNKGKTDFDVYASFDKADEYDKDNHYTYSFLATDTVMAHEAVTDYGYGIGGSLVDFGFGVLYDLAVSDTLTSISLGLSTGVEQEFSLIIHKYETNAATGKLSTTEEIYRQEKLIRPMIIEEPALHSYSIRPTILPAGKYFFEVRQSAAALLSVSVTNIRDNSGEVFIRRKDGSLDLEAGFGDLVLRANFAPVKAFTKDIKVQKITKPLAKGIFSSKETVEAILSNETFVKSESFKVYCNTGAQIKEQTISGINAHEERIVTFEVDLSEVGMHEICVYTALQGDQNLSNDSVKIVVESLSPNLDPYVMDFEHCIDFSTDVLYPGWTMVDGDQLPTVGISGYAFPGMFSEMAFIVFNPSSVDFDIPARNGERFGASMAPSSENGISNDDWLISPNLSLKEGSKLTMSVNTRSREEEFEICISTTDNQISSFTPISQGKVLTSGTWKDLVLDLSEYDNSPVFYLAIHCVSKKGFMFAVDDIKIHTSPSDIESANSSSVKLYPNPAKDFFVVQSSSAQITQIHLFDMLGNELYRSGEINENNHYVNVSNLDRGNYIILVQTSEGVSQHKLMKR